MSKVVILMGDSGTGKSTSIRNLNPKETIVINTINKPLPFREGFFNYNKENNNYYSSDAYSNIINAIKKINENKTIKCLVIDDFQFIMINEFMRRVKEKGYEKFSEMGNHVWLIFNECCACRDDLCIFILTHSELKDDGIIRSKTIGKMVDSYSNLESMATIVLHSTLIDSKYKLLTQIDSNKTAKSPIGLFDENEKIIDNDLAYVKEKIDQYYGVN